MAREKTQLDIKNVPGTGIPADLAMTKNSRQRAGRSISILYYTSRRSFIWNYLVNDHYT